MWIFNLKVFHRIIPLLRDKLHWLPISASTMRDSLEPERRVDWHNTLATGLKKSTMYTVVFSSYHVSSTPYEHFKDSSHTETLTEYMSSSESQTMGDNSWWIRHEPSLHHLWFWSVQENRQWEPLSGLIVNQGSWGSIIYCSLRSNPSYPTVYNIQLTDDNHLAGFTIRRIRWTIQVAKETLYIAVVLNSSISVCWKYIVELQVVAGRDTCTTTRIVVQSLENRSITVSIEWNSSLYFLCNKFSNDFEKNIKISLPRSVSLFLGQCYASKWRSSRKNKYLTEIEKH